MAGAREQYRKSEKELKNMKKPMYDRNKIVIVLC